MPHLHLEGTVCAKNKPSCLSKTHMTYFFLPTNKILGSVHAALLRLLPMLFSSQKKKYISYFAVGRSCWFNTTDHHKI